MFRGLTAVLVVALVAGAALATPTITYTLSLNAVYTDNTDTSSVALTQAQLASNATEPAGFDYDIKVTASVSGLTAGENLANLLIAFPGLADSTQSSGALKSDLSGTYIDWAPSTPPNVTIGKTAFAYFKNNEVDGTYPAPQNTFVAIAANVANNQNPGVSAPIYLGEIWVNWDGSTPTLLGATGATNLNNASTWEGNSAGQGTAEAWGPTGGNPATYVVNGVQFGGTTPEPATMALLAIGGIGALLRRRNA